MEDTPPPGDPDFLSHPAFDVDLKPLYDLTEQQYQAIVNQSDTPGAAGGLMSRTASKAVERND